MRKLRKAFTIWYIKRGYTFGYDFTDVDIYGDDILRVPADIPRVIWICPWWVKPLLIFFSPSIYYIETYGKTIAEGLARGLEEGLSKGE